MTTTTTPVKFYTLPANRLTAGMSTADGQDITNVWFDRERMLVGYDTYTPRHDDPAQDADNQCMPDARVAGWDELVDLAVFSDTEVDGRDTAVSRQEIAAIVDDWYERYARFSRIEEDTYLALRNRLIPLAPGDPVQFREPGKTRWFNGTFEGPVDNPDDPQRSGDAVVLSRSGRRVSVFLSSVRRAS